jgi:curved DNA-binding protein CbpA
MTDLYFILGLARDATPDEIKAAYRRCSSTAHPDKEGGSNERMQAVNRAYACLSDPAKRAAYDRSGSDEPSDSPSKKAEKILADAFNKALDTDAEPVKHCRAHISQTIVHLSEVKAKTEREMAKLAKRSGRTKTKEGVRNLVQEFIDRRLTAKSVTVNECTAALEACAIAGTLLDDYIADPEHTPPDTRTDLQRQQQRMADQMNAAQTGAFAMR